MFFIRPIFVFLTATVGTAIAMPPTKINGVGFDWHDPDNAACSVITATNLPHDSLCRTGTKMTGFGAHTPSWVCTAKSGEWMIYDSLAHCQAELETMQANAP